MKTILIFVFIISSVATQATGVYRTYLLSKVALRTHTISHTIQTETATYTINCPIPKITTPKGNVFCRLEDRLSKATKIWIKVGVK